MTQERAAEKTTRGRRREDAVPAVEGMAPEATQLQVLQRSLGNQGLRRLIENRRLQQMRSDAEQEPVTHVGPETQSRIAAEADDGKALDPVTRAEMESSAAGDLSGVQLHTGPAVNSLARGMGARAFTQGRDVFLGPRADRATLAHELTHVAQGQTGPGTVQRETDQEREQAIKEAEQTVAAMNKEEPEEELQVSMQLPGPGEQPVVYRKPKKIAPPPPQLDPRLEKIIETGMADRETIDALYPPTREEKIDRQWDEARWQQNERTRQAIATGQALPIDVTDRWGTVTKAGEMRTSMTGTAHELIYGSGDKESVTSTPSTGGEEEVNPRLPTIQPKEPPKPKAPEPFVPQRFNIELTIDGNKHSYPNLTAEQAIVELKTEWMSCRKYLEIYKKWHRELLQNNEDHPIVSFIVDTLNGEEAPPIEIWNGVDNELMLVMKQLDIPMEQLRRDAEEADRKKQDMRANPHKYGIDYGGIDPDLLNRFATFDPRQKYKVYEDYIHAHIAGVTSKLQSAANSLKNQEKGVFRYKEGNISRTETAVKGLEQVKDKSKMVLSLTPVGRGVGLARGAVYAAGINAGVEGLYGFAGQTGEILFGDRESYDFSKIGLDMAKAGIGGFIGGLAGGALGKAFGKAIGHVFKSKLGIELSDVALTRVMTYLTAPAANIATSPLTTTVTMTFEWAVGERKTLSRDELCDAIAKNFEPDQLLKTYALAVAGAKVQKTYEQHGWTGDITFGTPTPAPTVRPVVPETPPIVPEAAPPAPVAETPVAPVAETVAPVAETVAPAPEVLPVVADPQAQAPTPHPRVIRRPPRRPAVDDAEGGTTTKPMTAETAPVAPARVPARLRGESEGGQTNRADAESQRRQADEEARRAPQSTRRGGGSAMSLSEIQTFFGRALRRRAIIQDGNVELEVDVNTFRQALRNANGGVPPADPLPIGFVDPATGRVWVQLGGDTLTIFHESIHQYSMGTGSRQRFIDRHGTFMEEAITEWMTRRHLGPDASVQGYDKHVTFLERLMATRGIRPETIEAAYLDGNLGALRTEMQRGFGGDPLLTDHFFDRVRDIGVDMANQQATQEAVYMMVVGQEPPTPAGGGGGGQGQGGGGVPRRVPGETDTQQTPVPGEATQPMAVEATAGGPPPMPGGPTTAPMDVAPVGEPPPLPQGPRTAPMAEGASRGAPPPLPQTRTAAMDVQAPVGGPPPMPEAAPAPAKPRSAENASLRRMANRRQDARRAARQSGPEQPRHGDVYSDPVAASQVLADHVLLGEPVRLMDHETARAAWRQEYRGPGEPAEPPVAWYESGGSKLVVDASRVRMPILGTEIHQGPVRWEGQGVATYEAPGGGGRQTVQTEAPRETLPSEPPRPRQPDEVSDEGAPPPWTPPRPTDPPLAQVVIDNPQQAYEMFWQREGREPYRPPQFTFDRATYDANWRLAGGADPSPPAWIDQYDRMNVDANRVDVHNRPADASIGGTRTVTPFEAAPTQETAAPVQPGMERTITPFEGAPTEQAPVQAPAPDAPQAGPRRNPPGSIPGRPRSMQVLRRIDSAQEAAEIFIAQLRAGNRNARAIRNAAVLAATWRDFGQFTPPPLGWIDGNGNIIIDGLNVDPRLGMTGGMPAQSGGTPPPTGGPQFEARSGDTIPGMGPGRAPGPSGTGTLRGMGPGQPPRGGGPPPGGGGGRGPSSNRDQGFFLGIDAIDATNSQVEAGKALRQAMTEGNSFRLLGGPDTAVTAQEAWNGSFGRTGPAPLAWRDRYGNLYIDNQRARIADLLAPGDTSEPRFEPLPDLFEATPDPAPGTGRPRMQFDPDAQIRPGEIRGVAEVITDPARAAQLYYQQTSAGRFVRLMNSRAQTGWAQVEYAWINEYGGSGEPPIAWIDSRGYLVVDAGRVDIPLGY